MSGYEVRLIKCGVTAEKAEEICRDYLSNFSVGELEIHVRHLESLKDVGRMESEPDRTQGRGLCGSGCSEGS